RYAAQSSGCSVVVAGAVCNGFLARGLGRCCSWQKTAKSAQKLPPQCHPAQCHAAARMAAPSDSRTSRRTPPRSAAAAVADDSRAREMVKNGVLKAREKLIDLTMRNGMLNFRHSETSARHVRIVDQQLEFLAATLGSGH